MVCSENDTFRCLSGECINFTIVCDGVDNCVDGSDETFTHAHCYDMHRGRDELAVVEIIGLVLGCIVGTAILCCILGTVIECAAHVYKYWCPATCVYKSRDGRSYGCRRHCGSSSSRPTTTCGHGGCGTGPPGEPILLLLKAMPPDYSAVVVSCEPMSSVNSSSGHPANCSSGLAQAVEHSQSFTENNAYYGYSRAAGHALFQTRPTSDCSCRWPPNAAAFLSYTTSASSTPASGPSDVTLDGARRISTPDDAEASSSDGSSGPGGKGRRIGSYIMRRIRGAGSGGGFSGVGIGGARASSGRRGSRSASSRHHQRILVRRPIYSRCSDTVAPAEDDGSSDDDDDEEPAAVPAIVHMPPRRAASAPTASEAWQRGTEYGIARRACERDLILNGRVGAGLHGGGDSGGGLIPSREGLAVAIVRTVTADGREFDSLMPLRQECRCGGRAILRGHRVNGLGGGESDARGRGGGGGLGGEMGVVGLDMSRLVNVAVADGDVPPHILRGVACSQLKHSWTQTGSDEQSCDLLPPPISVTFNAPPPFQPLSARPDIVRDLCGGGNGGLVYGAGRRMFGTAGLCRGNGEPSEAWRDVMNYNDVAILIPTAPLPPTPSEGGLPTTSFFAATGGREDGGLDTSSLDRYDYPHTHGSGRIKLPPSYSSVCIEGHANVATSTSMESEAKLTNSG